MRRLLPAVLALLARSAGAARAADVARYANPLIGTLGAGFVFPGPDVPFGMVQNSPDTFTPGAGYNGLVYSGYMGNDPEIRDFSLVHLSGPGVAKAGDLPFMPWVGAAGQTPPSDPNQYATPFSHATEQAQPGYYAVTLANGIKTELTAALRAGMQRYTFPAAGDAYLIVDPLHRNSGGAGGDFAEVNDHEIAGRTINSHYSVYFDAVFDQKITGTGKTWVSFDPGQTVTMRVGISFVDAAGAANNLAQYDGQSFEDMRAAAYRAWNHELSKVRVGGGTVADKTTFYTALYHALLHPNVFNDADGRYIGFDGAVHTVTDRVQYANFSSWDEYKAENQLEATLEPARYADMLRSLLADADQDPNHRLPRWAEENYDPAHMSGDPAIPMIADGVCRGLLGQDEAEALYQHAVALRSFREPQLDQLGFLPGNPGTTLEYGEADFALALLAHRLGHDEDADRWLNASLDYRNILDPDSKWIRPRNADGTWYSTTPLGYEPTDDTGFDEGNSWQYSWMVPQDMRGLFDRMGGDDAAVQRLDEFFAAPSDVQNRLNGFGTVYRDPQWAPGNETDLGAPYVYPYAHQPWKTQAELRAAQQVYKPTLEGLPGNDDLGGLSGWYVWTALGMGPFTPGAPLLMVGAPVFTHVTIALPHGRFTIDAPGASLAGKYVQSAKLDGKRLDDSWFPASAIHRRGVLHLEMGVTPSTWGATDAPPSVSDKNFSLDSFGCPA